MVAGVNLGLLAALVALLPLLVPHGPAQSAPIDAVAIVYIVLALAGMARGDRAVQLPAKGPLTLVLVASVLATVFGLSVADGLLSLLVEGYLVLLFACVANELGGSRHGLRVILTVWSVAALIWATLFLAFHLELLPDGLHGVLAENSKSSGYRVSGTARNPNLAASYMMTSFFVLLASPWPRRRPARLAAIGWILAAVFVTGSNGALLGLATGVAVLLVACALRAGRTPRQRLGVAGATLVAGVLTLSAAVLAVGIPRVEVSDVQTVAQAERNGIFGGSLGRLDRSVGGRLEIWSQAWAHAGQRLLTGVGPGAAIRIPVGPDRLGTSLHNDYLAFLVERGILGILGLLGLCLAVLRWSALLLMAGDDAQSRRIRVAALGGAVVANLALATNHESFHFRHVWVLFAVVWACLPLVGRVPAAQRPQPVPGPALPPEELVHAGR